MNDKRVVTLARAWVICTRKQGVSNATSPDSVPREWRTLDRAEHPADQRKIPPNPWYGFRVRRTLDDPNVWYPVNVYSAWRMLWLGAGIMIVALVAYFVPGLDVAWYASVVGIVAAMGLLASLVQCFQYVRKLANETG